MSQVNHIGRERFCGQTVHLGELWDVVRLQKVPDASVDVY